MDNAGNTLEIQASKTLSEIIKEGKRLEESLMFSAKGHFSTANFWGNFHLLIGVPTVLLSAVAGASALAQFDRTHLIAGVLSILIVALTGIMTFLNPNEKASAHLNSGNQYAALQDKVRMFWCIDCWADSSEVILTERLKLFCEQKERLNQSSPQIPGWAYRVAKKGIVAGEGSYEVDAAR